MKQPLFVYEGKSYPVRAINFHKDGRLAHVSFQGENEYITAFQKQPWDVEGTSDGLFHTNLYKCLQLMDKQK